MLEYAVRRWHILHHLMIGAVLTRARLPWECIKVERQQLLHTRLKPHRCYHFGVNNVHVVQLSFAEQTDENIRNVPRTGNRRVLHGEHELAVHADVALGEVRAAHLTDEK